MPSAKHVQHDIDASTEEKHQSNCYAKLGLKWSLRKYTGRRLEKKLRKQEIVHKLGDLWGP